MRATIAIACGFIGTVLVGLSFLNPPVSDTSRPNVIGFGLVLILLGLVLTTLRPRPRRQGAAAVGVSVDERRAAQATLVREAAPPVARPQATIALTVSGNGAPDPWMRWYYVAAATTTGVAARGARVSVAVRGEPAGAEEWHWDGGRRAVDLTRSGARIPIVIGAIGESRQQTALGWIVPYRNWYLTPAGHAALGRFIAPFISGFRHVFEVSVRWKESGIDRATSASFELRFWREPTSEPRFLRVGDRPSYRDQLGGLIELRDRGAALRNDGMMLPQSALSQWLGRVDTWTNDARDLIAEVSVADSDYFMKLSANDAPMFEGVRIHDHRHRLALRTLHERLNRLRSFIRA